MAQHLFINLWFGFVASLPIDCHCNVGWSLQLRYRSCIYAGVSSKGGFRTRYALWQIITALAFIFDACIVLLMFVLVYAGSYYIKCY